MASSRARRQPVEAEAFDELDLEVVPGDGHRAGRGRSGDRHQSVGPRSGRVEGDLQRDHPAERAADDEVDAGRCRGRRGAATGRVPGRGWRPTGRSRRTAGPVRGSMRGGAGRAVAAAEQVGAQHADPVRVQRAARADERRPPVAGRIGRAGQGVDDDDLRRHPRGRAVMPVGDGQLRRASAVIEPNGPRSTDSRRPVPGRDGRPPRSPGRPGHPARADELAVGRAVGRRRREGLLEIGDEVVDVLEPDRQPDQVVGRRRSRSAPRASSCEWVVEAGWMISDLASPTLARSEKIWTLSMSRRPASTPPLTPNVTIAAEATASGSAWPACATGATRGPGS